MPLTAKEVEQAFVDTASEQVNGEPFDWQRLTDKLNGRLGRTRRAFFGGNVSPSDMENL